MKLRFKTPRSEWKNQPFTVPVNQAMKAEIDQLKKQGLDVNHHVREFLEILIEKGRTEMVAEAL